MDAVPDTDFAVAGKDRLYRRLDLIVGHKQALVRVAETEMGLTLRSGLVN